MKKVHKIKDLNEKKLYTLKKFYDLRNEIVHNQSILFEKYDENIQPVDQDRKRINLEYKTLKKYGNVVKNYFCYILKIIVYPEEK